MGPRRLSRCGRASQAVGGALGRAGAGKARHGRMRLPVRAPIAQSRDRWHDVLDVQEPFDPSCPRPRLCVVGAEREGRCRVSFAIDPMARPAPIGQGSDRWNGGPASVLRRAQPFHGRNGAPTYSLRGRMSLLLACCSMMWAAQPVMRLATKMGVYCGTGMPIVKYT